MRAVQFPRMIRSVVVLAICQVLVHLALQATAADSFPTDPEELKRFTLAGWSDNCGRWRSGEYRVTGHLEISDDQSPISGPMEIYSAFNVEAGSLRFDRKEPIWIAPAQGSEEAKNANTPLRMGQQGGKFVSTPDKNIVWRLDGHFASVARPGRTNEPVIRPFEIFLVGGQSWDGMESAFYRDPDWKASIEMWRSSPVAEAAVEEGLIRLTWIHAGDEKSRVDDRQDLWFSPDQGFCPVKYLLKLRSLKNKRDWSEVKPRELTETNWAKKGDVWAPTYCRQEVFGSTPKSRELQFEWLSVNQPVDENHFTLAGLEYPQQREHVDHRLGKPVSVQPIERAALPPAPTPRQMSFRYWLITINVIILLVIVGCLLFRKRASTKS